MLCLRHALVGVRLRDGPPLWDRRTKHHVGLGDTPISGLGVPPRLEITLAAPPCPCSPSLHSLSHRVSFLLCLSVPCLRYEICIDIGE